VLNTLTDHKNLHCGEAAVILERKTTGIAPTERKHCNDTNVLKFAD